jgi:hypothetical protein
MVIIRNEKNLNVIKCVRNSYVGGCYDILKNNNWQNDIDQNIAKENENIDTE